MFLVMALALGEPAAKLQEWVDVPMAGVGDYYYLHKLTEAIKAHRSVR